MKCNECGEDKELAAFQPKNRICRACYAARKRRKRLEKNMYKLILTKPWTPDLWR